MYQHPLYPPYPYAYGPERPDEIYRDDQMLQYGPAVGHGERMPLGGMWRTAGMDIIARKQMPGSLHSGQYVDRSHGASLGSTLYPFPFPPLAGRQFGQTPLLMPYSACNGSLPTPYSVAPCGSGMAYSPGYPSPRSALSPLPRSIEAPSSSLGHETTRSGPPIKPKRSGHAIWVGNIAPNTGIYDMKEHFSDGFKQLIESVYSMRKTNCAFVNYRSDRVCRDAVSKFNQTLLGMPPRRVLCRLRRDSATDIGTPDTEEDKENRSMNRSRNDSTREMEESTSTQGESDNHSADTMPSEQNPNTRYFVMKSLHKTDLDHSFVTSAWKTQVHNQSTLHRAFHGAETVYLIFSANGTGEYYGVAIMLSSPLDNHSSLQVPAQDENASVVLTTTPETKNAPRGRVIDDAGRGVLFWEADHEEQNVPSNSDEVSNVLPVSRPFRIRWIHRNSIGFDRVRGIRNPWNEHKDVKVARDGTELETGVGKRLLVMFEQQTASAVDSGEKEYTP